jgi:hypothetical protein
MFQELHLLTGNELDKIAITALWTGACLLLGQIGKIAKSQPTAISPKLKQSQSQDTVPPSAVKFSEETKVAKKPGNRLFISKAKPKPTEFTAKISKRKYQRILQSQTPSNYQPFRT